MRRVFLSALGTRKYLDCIYKFDGKVSSPVNYVQEALIEFICEDWDEKDLILIFCTREAEKNNWRDRKDFGKGLESRLKSLAIKPQVKMVLIPDGKSDGELFDIFNVLLKELKSDDSLFLDLTYSTRLQPFLYTVAAGFTKMVKGVRIAGVYYGAPEVVGTVERLRKLKAEERVIPIFDLTSFYRLLELGSEIESFSVSRSLNSIANFFQPSSSICEILGLSSKDEELFRVKQLLERLENIYRCLLHARSSELENDYSSSSLYTDLFVFESIVSPFRSIMDVETSVDRGFNASRWCLKRGLLLQALIFAGETTLTELCKLENRPPNDFHFRRTIWNDLLLHVGSENNRNFNKNEQLLKGFYVAKAAFKNILFGKVNMDSRETLFSFLHDILSEAEEGIKHRHLSKEQLQLKEQYGERLNPLAVAYAGVVKLKDNMVLGGWTNDSNGTKSGSFLADKCSKQIENLYEALIAFMEQI